MNKYKFIPYRKGQRVLFLTDEEALHVPLSADGWSIGTMCTAAVIANQAIEKMMEVGK